MSEQPEALRLAKLIEGNWSRDMGFEAAAELRRLHEENERLRDDYLRACGLVADMHAAATGGHDGPRRGVVEDIQDLRAVNQELLEALKQCDEAMTWELGGEPLDTLMIAARTAARAAIAKAEVETK